MVISGPVFIKKASTLALVALDKNFMHMGGFTLAKERMEAGKDHIPSPQIIPAAIAGAKAPACLMSFFSHTYKMKLPKHMSITKYDPKKKGIAIAMMLGM